MKFALLALMFVACDQPGRQGAVSTPIEECEYPEPLECQIAEFIPYEGEGVSLIEIREYVDWPGKPSRIPEVIELLEPYGLEYNEMTERYRWSGNHTQGGATYHFCISADETGYRRAGSP
jgi:hypothetical protein